MSKVAVIGSFNVDHVWRCANLPRPGQTLSGSYASHAGGKGFNQAVAARRAGADTLFICALGSDAGGQLARALAAADGIDLRDQSSEAPTGTAGIYVDAHGCNSIVIGPGANAALRAGFIDAHAHALAQATVALAQLESPNAAVARGLTLARAAGALCLLNPAPANAATTEELLALTDVLTPNESEFCALLARHRGMTLEPAALAQMGEAGLHALCRALHPHGSVVVTLGEAGCFVSHADAQPRGDAQTHYALPAERVDAVDTTGAGDAFNGALAASLALRARIPFAAHAAFANHYAARSILHHGAAASMPHLPIA